MIFMVDTSCIQDEYALVHFKLETIQEKINVLILNFCSMLWRNGERIFLKGGKERGKEKEGQK